MLSSLGEYPNANASTFPAEMPGHSVTLKKVMERLSLWSTMGLTADTAIAPEVF
jgi:hypothetical protein